MENAVDITGLIIVACFIPCLFIMVLMIAGPIIFVVESSKGNVGQITPTQTSTIKSNLPISKVFSTIIDFAQQNKYKIDDIDEGTYQIVLNESASLFSWGFFYLISVHQNAQENISVIEIGIRSKLIQKGPITRHHHNRLTDRIKASLIAIKDSSE